MKRSLFVAFLTLLVVGATGCSHFARKSATPVQYRPRAFAIAITVNGVLQPTPQQWAAIQAKVVEELAPHGWILVSDLALADQILRIDFTPNPNDPENSGRARLIGVRPNPRLAIASTSSIGRYPTSFGYMGTFQNASWGFGGFSNNYYYGWSNSYYDGYSYSSANLNPSIAPIPPATQPIHPPHRPHPVDPEICPSPWDNSRRQGPSDGYVSRIGGDPSRTPPSGTHHAWRGGDGAQSQPTSSYASADRRSWRAEGSTGETDASGARVEKTHTRAEPSRSQLEYVQSRHGSESPRSDRNYSRSDASNAGADRTYSRSDSSRSWQDRSDAAGRSDSSSSRPERSYSRSDSGSSGSDRSYSRSESSYSRSESSHSRSESSYSRSDSSSSRSEGSHSHSRESSSSSPAASSSPAPAPAPAATTTESTAATK